MRIKRFAVSGFKNFTQEVVLDDMGDICVIHGENNVGKSNLLEAMLLLFSTCFVNFKNHFGPKMQYFRFPITFEMTPQDITGNLKKSLPIFNLESKNVPIYLSTILEIESELFLDDASIKQMFHSNSEFIIPDLFEIKIDFQINQQDSDFGQKKYIFLMRELIFSDVRFSSQQKLTDDEENTFSVILRKIHNILITHIVERHWKGVSQFYGGIFIIIGTDRRIAFREVENEQERCIIPQFLKSQLYDLRNSSEPDDYKRWQLFARVMKNFSNIFRKGEFITTYDRTSGLVDLVFETEDIRISVDSFGSGIQQVVALIARLLVSNATFVAIEEPELNLRYTLQQRLYEVFKEIVADPAGPSQIFLTSHSPAFEHGEHFYHMRATEHGVIVEKRPISQARIATGMNCDDSLAGKSAPYSYVTSEGLVRLPEHVLQDLAIPHGGGVYFLKRKDTEHVELLTDEQYFDLFESADEETSEHE